MSLITFPRDVLNIIINPSLIGYSSVYMCSLTCRKLRIYRNPKIRIFQLLQSANRECNFEIFRWIWNKSKAKLKFNSFEEGWTWTITDQVFLSNNLMDMKWVINNLHFNKTIAITRLIESGFNTYLCELYYSEARLGQLDPSRASFFWRKYDLNNVVLIALKSNNMAILEWNSKRGRTNYPIKAYLKYLLQFPALNDTQKNTLKYVIQYKPIYSYLSFLKHKENKSVYNYVLSLI
jgi:hypothetical protein